LVISEPGLDAAGSPAFLWVEAEHAMGYPMRHTESRPNTAMGDWQRIAERLRRLAMALTGDAERAEELCQQTLVVLLARSPEHAEHVGYARRAMVRQWMDEQRSVRRRVARVAALARIGVRAVPRPEEGADRAETLARVRSAMEVLPAKQRAALVMRLVEGLEYEQIAEAMGCSVGAVRANLHLAREAVRRQIGEAP
jgi:RNA polymerase sigma factor (sigma-70 family)